MRATERSGWIKILIFLSPFIVGTLTFIFPSTNYFEPINSAGSNEDEPSGDSRWHFQDKRSGVSFDFPPEWHLVAYGAPRPKGVSFTVRRIEDSRALEALHLLVDAASSEIKDSFSGLGFEASIVRIGERESQVLIEPDEGVPILVELQGGSTTSLRRVLASVQFR